MEAQAGLDLEGGTQLVLQPVLVGNSSVSQDQLNQARDIIVQRVDANGVAGAEVTTRNGQDIVVSMPGIPDRATEDAIRKSSQMRFRPVILAAAGTTAPTPTTTPTGTSTGPLARSPTGKATTPRQGQRQGHAGDHHEGRVRPARRVRPRDDGARCDRDRRGHAPAASATPERHAQGTAKPANASDPAWVTPAIAAQFQALDCVKDASALDKLVDDPAKPLVTCNDTGTEKFVLGPVEVRGDQISDAQAGYVPLSNGQPSTQVEIRLSFNGSGTDAFGKVTHPPGQPARPAQPLRRHARLQGAHRACRAGRHPHRTGQHHRQLHHRQRPRPRQPAQVRCAADVVLAADP